MGEEHSRSKAFGMNIEIIGENMENFKKEISRSKSKYSIQNYWTFHYENIDINEQINRYFNKLQGFRKGVDKTINIKECLIVKIDNIFDPQVNMILEKINSLGQIQYMPLVLFLLKNNFSYNTKLPMDSNKFKRIDLRLILIAEYDENNPNKIEPILLRFCSIHNELGDRFTVGSGDDEESYDLIYNYYPFNINIACVGRFGQGKSTGVNAILQEYKAKESSKGSSQTKNLTYYQVSNQPIRLLDIPGFEDTNTVKEAVAKFQKCGEKINKIKDNLHIVLYFLSYTEERAFQGLELPIFEEFCKHKSSKIIYVITHSDPNMDEIDKEDKIRNLSEGLQNLTKNSEIHRQTKVGGMLEPNENNIVFVNFHRDNKTKFEPFGLRDLFKKIYDFFTTSEDYINSTKTLTKEIIEEKAKKLRIEAEELLKAHKVGGAIVGIIPGIDWVLQRFVIKKDAAKKVGQIYGIDVSFIDEKEKKNVNRYKPEYITASIDTEQLDLKVKGEELVEESTSYKVGNSFKVTGEAASYISGGTAIGTGIIRASTIATEGATGTASATAATAAVGIGSTALKVVGTGLFVVGAAVGVALGGYFTHKYCQELIDKFENYYKNNAEKVGNSYRQAAEYLLNQ